MSENTITVEIIEKTDTPDIFRSRVILSMFSKNYDKLRREASGYIQSVKNEFRFSYFSFRKYFNNIYQIIYFPCGSCWKMFYHNYGGPSLSSWILLLITKYWFKVLFFHEYKVKMGLLFYLKMQKNGLWYAFFLFSQIYYEFATCSKSKITFR